MSLSLWSELCPQRSISHQDSWSKQRLRLRPKVGPAYPITTATLPLRPLLFCHCIMGMEFHPYKQPIHESWSTNMKQRDTFVNAYFLCASSMRTMRQGQYLLKFNDKFESVKINLLWNWSDNLKFSLVFSSQFQRAPFASATLGVGACLSYLSYYVMSQRSAKLLNGTKAHGSWSFSAIHILSFYIYVLVRLYSQSEHYGGLLSPDDNPIKIQGKKRQELMSYLWKMLHFPQHSLHYQSFDYAE